ncbi:MAG: YceI family protein [Acidimicrobiia bacterium]
MRRIVPPLFRFGRHNPTRPPLARSRARWPCFGELTINGVTNPVEITLEAQLINSMILVTGTTDISFADYEVEAPTAPVVLSVEDHGTVEVQLWLARQ